MIKHKSRSRRTAEYTITKCGICTEGRNKIVKCWKDVTCKNCLKTKGKRKELRFGGGY